MTAPASPAASTPAYAFPLRALRRWRDQHLTLRPGDDGGVRATFRLEGSTCGNVAFLLDYHVRLSPAADGHRLLELTAAPAPHDDNHVQMCAAREDVDRLLATLRREQPCLGQPLATTLDWRPTTQPAGCLCALNSRARMWQAVYHTLHYALYSERS